MKTAWETERAPARKTTEVLTVSLLNSFLSGPPYTWWILTTWNIVRSSHQRCFVRNGAIRNFAKFTGKHLCQSLFFNKVASLSPATLLKKDFGTGVFLWILQNFLEHFFTEHLQVTASVLALSSSQCYTIDLASWKLRRKPRQINLINSLNGVFGSLWSWIFLLCGIFSFFMGIICCSSVALVWTFNTRAVYNVITKKVNIPVNLAPFFNDVSLLFFAS